MLDRLLAWGIFAASGYLAWRYFFDDDRVLPGVAVVVGAVLLVSVVYAVALGLAGISPGKALVGLRVVSFADGRPIGVPRAILRTAVLGFFTLPTAGLGLATLAWTAVMDPGGRRRGGHDRMTDAVVVDVRPAPEVGPQDDARPRQIVNLTALRLAPPPKPAPTPAAAPAPTPTPPTAPQRPQEPSGPPAGPPPGPPGAPPAGPRPDLRRGRPPVLPPARRPRRRHPQRRPQRRPQ